MVNADLIKILEQNPNNEVIFECIHPENPDTVFYFRPVTGRNDENITYIKSDFSGEECFEEDEDEN